MEAIGLLKVSQSHTNYQKNKAKKQNPLRPHGKPSRCFIWESTINWAKNCQHAFDKGNEEDVFETNIVLMNLNNSGDSMLLGQTTDAMTLDSGCSRSVYGSPWHNRYLNTLPDKILKKKHKKT